ncbi:MAG: class I SAM-dependent RNA methyltransferase [Flavobacteriales bacterium]
MPVKNWVAKTFQGLEEVLAEELSKIGATDIEIATRAVLFKGNDEVMMKAHLYLATALNILTPIADFSVDSFDDLYEKSLDIPWENYFSSQKTFAVTQNIHSVKLNHSQYGALRVKDAIADRFRKVENKRPSVDREKPSIVIHVQVNEDKARILLDASGEALFKRGYRKATGDAPINEVLAAGMIRLSGWNGNSTFVDPMCGSGTIAIEAAIYAHEIPPGIFRTHYAFLNWKAINLELWEKLYTEANRASKAKKVEIFAFDRFDDMLEKAKMNVESHRFLRKSIIFNKADFNTIEKPAESGIVMFNPPYGKRLDVDDVSGFYSKIGDVLKKKFTGYTAWIIAPEGAGAKSVGLKPSKKYSLFNGGIACKLLEIELYQGTRKSD